MIKIFTRFSFLLIFLLLGVLHSVSSQTADFRVGTAGEPLTGGCGIATYKFFDQSSSLPADVTTIRYNWDFGTGSPVVGIPNDPSITEPERAYGTPGRYIVRLRITNAAGTVIISERTREVIVYDRATPNFTAPAGIGCTPYAVTFSDATVAGTVSTGGLVGDIVRWTWNFGDGTTITGTDPSFRTPTHTYNFPGDYQVTLTVETFAGGRETCQASIIRPNAVRVRWSPQAAFRLQNGPACSPPFVARFENLSTVRTSPPPAGVITSYLWEFFDQNGNPAGTSTDVNPAFTYNTFGTYRVRLTATTADGCASVRDVPDAIVIRNNTAAFDIPPIYCANNSQQFFDRSSAGAVGWSWNFGDGTTSTAQNPNKTYAAPGTYPVTLTTTFTDGCSVSVTRNVTIQSLPNANFTVNPPDNLCDIGTRQLLPALNDPANYTYEWRVTDPAFAFGEAIYTAPTPTHNFTAFRTYPIRLTITDRATGCSNTLTRNLVLAEAVPRLEFIGAQPTTTCAPVTFNFTARNSTSVEGIIRYDFDFGDGSPVVSIAPPFTPTGFPDVSHTYTTPGVYTPRVTITTASGCTRTGNFNQQIRVGTPPPNTITLVPSRNGCATIGGVGITFTPNIPPGVCADSVVYNFGDGSAARAVGNVGPVTHEFRTIGSITVNAIFYCNGCPTIAPVSATVNVDGPIALFNVVGGGVACASGSTFSFQNTSVDAATGTTTYEWDFGDGSATQVIARGAPVNYTYATPGVYTVRLRAVGSNGCVNERTATVNISVSAPSFTVTPSPAGPICSNTPVRFTSTSTTSGTITRYRWDFDDGTIMTIDGPAGASVTHTYAPRTDPYRATLTITESNGCAESVSAPVNITIQGARADFTVPTVVCVGDPVNFADGSTVFPNTNAITSWNWFFQDGIANPFQNQSVQNPTYTFLRPGTWNVTLTVADNNGIGPCTSTITRQVTVLPRPVGGFNVSSTTFCAGSPMTITSNAIDVPGGTGLTYTWDFGTAPANYTADLSTPANPVIRYNNAGSYTITQTVTAGNTCAVTFSRVINVIAPDATISAQAATGPPVFAPTQLQISCPPAAVRFRATPFPDADIEEYFWEFGDGNRSFDQNPENTYINPGVYTVRLSMRSRAGCTIVRELTNFIRVDGPRGQFIFTPTDICIGDPVTFTASNLQNVAFYQWDFGDGTPATAPVAFDPVAYAAAGNQLQRSHVYLRPGTFQPVLILQDGNTPPCRIFIRPDGGVRVRVSGKPTAAFSWPNNSGNICENNSFVVTDESTSDVDTPPTLSPQITRWQWDVFDVNPVGNPAAVPVRTQVITSAPGNYTFANNLPAGNYWIRLRVRTAFGCEDDEVKQIQLVAPVIFADFENDQYICVGSPANFNAGNSTDPATRCFTPGGAPVVPQPAPGACNAPNILRPPFSWSFSGGTPLALIYEWEFSIGATILGTATGQRPTFTFPVNASNPSQPYDVTVRLTVRDALLCASGVTKTSIITVNPLPRAALNPSNVTICHNGGTNTASFTAQADPAIPGTVQYRWQVDSGAGFGDLTNGGVYSGVNSATLTLTDVPEFMNGWRFRVRIQNTNNIQCEAFSAPATLTVIPTPTPATVVSPINLCNATTATLTGNAPAAGRGTGRWVQLSGPTVINFGAQISNPTPTITVSNGVYTFRWDITTTANGVNCVSQSPVLTVNNSRSANAGPDQSVCEFISGTTTPITVTLAGNNPAVGGGGTGEWTVVSRPVGSPLPTFTPNANAFNATVSGFQSGVYTLRWSITGAPGCGDTQDDMVITVNPLPIVASPTSLTACANSTVNISALVDPSLNIQWEIATPSDPTNFNAVLNGVFFGATFSGATTNTLTIANIPAALNGSRLRIRGINATTGCFNYSNAATLTVTDEQNNEVTDASICQGTAATIIVRNALAGYTYTLLQGATVVESIVAPANADLSFTPVSPSTSTNYRVRVTTPVVGSGSCVVDLPDQAVITVTPIDQAVTNADFAVCNVTSVTLTGNIPIVTGSGTWTQVSGPPVAPANRVLSGPSNNIITLNNLQAGRYTFRWSITNSACPDSQDDVTFTLTNSANAGADQQFCLPTTNTTLAGNIPYTGTAIWSFVSGPGGTVPMLTPVALTAAEVTDGASSPYSVTVTGMTAPGVYRFRYAISGGACPPSEDLIDVFIAAPANVTTANARLCNVSSFVMTADVPVVGAGNWSLAFTDGPVPTLATSGTGGTTLTANGLGRGRYVFRWTVTGSPCGVGGSTFDEIEIFNDAPANAGADIALCGTVNPTSVQLNAVAAVSGTTGTWTQVGGPALPAGSFISPNAANTFVNNLVPGNVYDFRWTISGGSACPQTEDDVRVTVSQPPSAAVAGTNKVLCASNTATMDATAPVFGTGVWTLVTAPATATGANAPVIVNALSPTTAINNLNIIGTYTFRWTVSNPGCPSTSADVNIVVQLPFAATAGADANVCAATYTMAANTAPTGSTGQWTFVSGPVTPTIATATSPTTGISNMNVAGEYVFRWRLTNATCISESLVTIRRAIVDAGPDVNTCGTGNTVTLNAQPPIVGTGRWTFVSGPNAVTFSNDLDRNATVNGLTQSGVYTIRWTVTGTPCGTTFDDLVINVAAPANAGADINICGTTNPVTLGATPVVGAGTGTWTVVSGPNTPTFSSATSATAQFGTGGTLQVGTYVLRWRVTGSICPDSEDLVTVNVSPATISAGANQTLCLATSGAATSATLTGTTPVTGTGTWSQVSGPALPAGSIASPNSASTTVSNLGAGVYVFQWSVTGATCPGGAPTVTITVAEPPRIITPPISPICVTGSTATVTVSGNVPLIGTGTWTRASGPGAAPTITASASGGVSTATVSGLEPGTHVLQWAFSGTAPCTFAPAQVTVVVQPAVTTATIAPATQSVCIDQATGFATATMTGSVPAAGNTGTWTRLTGPGTATLTPGGAGNSTLNISNLEAGTHTFEWRITNSCGVSVATASITVNPTNAPAAITPPAATTICATPTTGTISLTGNAPVTGTTGTWSRISGPGAVPTFTTSGAGGSSVTITGLAVGTHRIQWALTNAACPANNSTATIDITIVAPDPVAAITPPASTDVCTTGATGLASVSLAGNAPVTGTGAWSRVSGPGAATLATSGAAGENATFSNLQPGLHTFQWTITNPTCGNTSAQVTIRIVERDAVAAIDPAPANVCADPATNRGAVTLNGNVPVSGTGTWTRQSGPGTFTLVTAGTGGRQATFSDLQVGTHVFRWTINNPVCGNTFAEVSITVQEPTPVASITGNLNVCASDPTGTLGSTILAGNNSYVGTGTWTRVGGTGDATALAITIGGTNNNVATITGMGFGTHVFQWEMTNGVCPPTSAQVTVTVNRNNPQADIAGANPTICTDPVTNLAQTTLTANEPVVGTGTWTRTGGTADGTGVAIAASTTGTGNAIANITGMQPGTHVFRYTLNSGCGTTFDEVTVTVNPSNPAAAITTAPGTVCTDPATGRATLTLTGNEPRTGTGTWTRVGGAGDPTGHAINTSGTFGRVATITGLLPGQHIFQWQLANSCGTTSTTFTVNVEQSNPLAAIISTVNTVCTDPATQQANVTLQGNTPITPGSGTWSYTGGTGSTATMVISTPNNPTANITGLQAGTYQFTWTLTNSCGTSNSSVTVTVNPSNPVANAGADATRCDVAGGASISLNGNAPISGTGTWTRTGGTGSPTGVIITPTGVTSADVTGMGVGTHEFTWTLTNGCGTTSDVMVVTVQPANPPANAGANQAVCTDLGTGRASATLTGNAPTVGTGTWARVGGTGNPAGITLNQVGNVLNISNMLPGSHIFEWTLTSPGCGSTSSLVTVFVNESNPLAAITTTPPSPDVCADPVSNLGAVTLTGNTPNSGAGTWTRIGGTGSTSSMSISVAGTTLNATGLGVGTHTFEWRFTSPCGNSAATYTVNIIRQNPPATATAAATQVCADAATLQGTVNLIGNAPVSGTGTWTRTAGAGTFTITNPNSPNTDVTGLAVGTHTFQWTLTNGACTSTNATVTVTIVRPNPAATAAAAAASVCADAVTDLGTVQLIGNAPVSGTGTWERTGGTGAFGGMTIVDPNNATTNVTGLGVGTHTFRWVLANGVCGTTQASVTVTVVRPNAPATASAAVATICADAGTGLGTANLTGNAPASGTGTWTRVGGTGGATSMIISPAGPGGSLATVTGLGIGTHTFRWTLTNDVCGSTQADVTVTVNAPNPTPVITGILNVCATPTLGETVLTGTEPATGGTGAWSRVGGTGDATSMIIAPSGTGGRVATITGLGEGTHIFEWRLSNTGCPATATTVTVTVTRPNPAATASAVATTVCADAGTGLGTVSLVGSAVVSGSGTWTRTGGTGNFAAMSIANATNPNTDVSGLGEGTHTFRWTVVNGVCGTTSADVTVTITRPNPAATAAAVATTVCANPATGLGTVSLQGNAPVSGTGTWTRTGGTGSAAGMSIANANSANTDVSGLGAGTHIFRWTLANGVCGTTSADITVTITAPNPVATAAAVLPEVCATGGTGTVDLTGSAVVSGTGTWTRIAGTGTFNIVSPNTSNTSVTGLEPGTHTFRWTVANGVCGTTTADVMVRVLAPNPAVTASVVAPVVCADIATNTGSVSLQGSAVVSGTGTWTRIAGTGTFTIADAANPNTAVSGLEVGNHTFRWTVANGACGTSSADVTVTIVRPNPAATASSPAPVLCATGGTATADLTGNVPVSGTGAWTRVSGPGTFSIADAASAATTASGLTAGTHVFRWTLTNGVCGSTSADVTITVVAPNPPISAAAVATTVCADPITNVGTVTLQGSAVISGTGTWTRFSGSGTFSIANANDPNTDVNGLAPGIHTFRWTVVNGVCGTTSADVTVTITRPNPAATAAAVATTVCANPATGLGTVSLQGNAPVSGTGTWTRTGGTGSAAGMSIANANSANTDVSGLGAGTHIFRWTVVNGVCGTTSADITVTITAPNPVATAAAVLPEVCATGGTGTVDLTGSAVVSGTGTWTRIAGTGTFNIVSPNTSNTSVTGLEPGTHTFRWTVANGVCGTTTADVTVRVLAPNPAVTASVVAPVVCADIATNTGSVSLQGSAVVSGTGTWTRIAGTGTFTIADAANANTTVSGLSVGNHTFRWTVANGACGTSSADVTVTITRPNPAATASSPAPVLCATGGTATADLTGNVPVSGTGAWTRVSGPGTFSIADAASAATTASGLTAGTHVFRWTLTNGVCGSTSADVTITVVAPNPPISAAAVATTVCADPITNVGTVTLQGSAVTSGTGTWTRFSGSGTFSIANANDPNTDVNGLAPGIHTFRWTVVNGVCGTTSADVTVTITRPNPAATAAAVATTVCANPATGLGTVSLQGNAPVSGTGTWTRTGGTGSAAGMSIANANSANTDVSGLGAGTHIFRWTLANGVCGTTSADITVTITAPNPVATAAAVLPEVCATGGTGTVDLTGSAVTSGTGTWTRIAGAGTFNIVSPNTSNTSVTGLEPGTHTFRWTVANGVCGTTTADVTVRVLAPNPAVTASVVAPVVCADIATNTGSVSLQGSAVVSGTGTWTRIAGTGTFTIADAANPNTAVSGLEVGNHTFRWTVANGACGTSSADVTVTIVRPNPAATASSPAPVLCATGGTATADLTGNVPVSGTGAWTRVSGPGTFSIADAASAATTASGLTAGTHVFRWTLTNGVCGSTSADVTITVVAPNPPISAAAVATTVCADPITNVGTVTLQGSAVISGTGTWTRFSGSGTFSIANANDPNTDVNGLAPGIHTFRWTVVNGVCGTTSADVTVTITRPNPAATAAAVATTVCANPATGLGTVSLQGNAPVSGTGTWTRTGGTGSAAGMSIANANSANTDVSGLGAGTHIFRWTLSNGVCGTTSADITVTITAPNPVATVTASQTTVCADVATNLGTVTLNGTVPVSGTGTWSRTGGSGSAAAMLITLGGTGNSQATVSGLGVGTHIFQWTLDNGICGTTSATITITVASPIVDIGTDQTLCTTPAGTADFTLTGPVPVLGTTSWQRVGGTGSGSVIISTSGVSGSVANITGMGPGTHIIRYTITGSPCGTIQDEVTLTVVPSVISAGSDQIVCLPTGATTTDIILTGTNPIAGAGNWLRVGGTGSGSPVLTASGAGNSQVTITGMGAGTHIFEYSITGSPCAPAAARVTITVGNSAAPAGAGPDQNLCNTTTGTLTAVPAVGGTGRWAQVSGPNTASIANPLQANTPITGLVPGIYVFRWSITGGACPASFDDVTISVAAPANAGPDQALCQVTTVTMAANSAINGRGTWRQVSGPNTARIDDPANPRTAIAGMRPGTYTFRWTITGNGCPETSDDVVITISAPAVAGPAQTVCVGTEVRLAAEPVAVGTGRWTQVDGPVATISNPTSPDATLGSLVPGNYRFRWTITGGDCNPGSSDEVSITVVGITAADRLATVSDAEYSTCPTEIPANVTITVSPTRAGVRYELRNGSTVLANALGNDGVIRFTIPAPAANRELLVVAIASANGVTCPEVELTDRAVITARPCPPPPPDRPVIGVAKQALPAVRQVNGAFHIPIVITVRNYGDVPLTNIVVSDDMTNVFPAPARYSIVRQPITTGSLVANPQFDGTAAQPNLVTGGRLEVGESQTVTFVVSLIPNRATGPFFNTAIAEGSHNTTRVRDISVDGQNPDPNFDGDPRETSPTIIQVPQPANRAPIAVDDLFTVQGCSENNGGNILTNDRDPDEDELVATVVTNATTRRGGRISIAANGAITYTPAFGFTGTDEFTYEVCDRVTPPLCSRATITFNVTACPNRPPRAVDITLSTDNCTNIDQVLEIPLVDADGDPVRVTIISDLVTPLRGILSLSATGRLTYRPALNAQGQERITYQVCDNRNPALCATGTIFINVFLCTNQPPVVTPRRENTDNCTEIRGSVLQNVTDPNGDRVSVRAVTGARSQNGGVFSINADGSFVYTPPQGFTGQDEFTYTVCDNGNPLSKCTEGKVVVDVLVCRQVFIPRGFSPNGDGVNDKFEILGADRYDIHLRIYNRWGNLVFEDEHYKNTWDGTPQGVGIVIGDKVPDGTYYFIVDLRDGSKPVVDFLTIQR